MEYEYFIIGCSYVIGAFPAGYIVSRLFFRQDIRLYGSGNIGATNVARVHGKMLFVPILLFDALKAYGAVILGQSISPFFGLICGFACFVGNIFSLFLGGMGGKGVSTTVGIVLAINPLVGVCFSVIWASALSIVSRVGIASVVALASLSPVALYFGCNTCQCLLFTTLSAISIWRHSSNIVLFLRS